jgi:uncharacterized protein YjbI with pentapeptide repeats
VGSLLYQMLSDAGGTVWPIGYLGGAGLLLLGIALVAFGPTTAEVHARWAVMMLLGFPLSIAAAAQYVAPVTHIVSSSVLLTLAFFGGLVSSTVGLILLGRTLWMTAKWEEARLNLPPLRSRLWAWANVSGKTGWEWFELLIVPLVLVVIGLLFGLQQDARQQAVEEQRTQDIALQGYLDQMGTLMLEDLSNPRVRTLMRARTLSVLKRLDATRKAEVMQFLVEAELIKSVGESEPVIDLRDADLVEADLSDADLEETDLSYVDLSGAFLNSANLKGADLSGADLSYASLFGLADLSSVDLSGAELAEADLTGADLTNADLRGAYLTNSDLTDADLSSADLTNVHDVIWHQLEMFAESLEGATMADGTINAGLYATREFEPSLSFSVSDGWRLARKETPNVFHCTERGCRQWIPEKETTNRLPIEGPGGGQLIFTAPRHVFHSGNPSDPKEVPAPKNADEWVSWLQRHPNLETSKPDPVNLGGASGMRIDVTTSSMPETYPEHVCGKRPCVPIYKAASQAASPIVSSEGWKERFVIVAVEGEMVVIDVAGPVNEFDDFLPKAQKVLDSVEWRGA